MLLTWCWYILLALWSRSWPAGRCLSQISDYLGLPAQDRDNYSCTTHNALGWISLYKLKKCSGHKYNCFAAIVTLITHLGYCEIFCGSFYWSIICWSDATPQRLQNVLTFHSQKRSLDELVQTSWNVSFLPISFSFLFMSDWWLQMEAMRLLTMMCASPERTAVAFWDRKNQRPVHTFRTNVLRLSGISSRLQRRTSWISEQWVVSLGLEA